MSIIMLALLLLAGSVVSEVWAAKVTYHILTLPIDSVSRYNYHMKAAVHEYRLEAFKVVVDNQSTVELPGHYKSPLATGFTYYKPEDIIGHGGSAVNLYDYGPNKGVLYKVKGVDTADPVPTAVAEGATITGSTAEYYVIYTYNASNTIAKLDGSVNYNIGVNGKGFLALNRGRNNRPAVVPKAKVNPEMLALEDFSYVDSPGAGITTFWADGNNKNKRSDTESKFFFLFKFEGKDPYHIVVRTSYAKDSTYIEKNDNVKPDQFVYKWYKEGSLFAQGTANCYIASDEHKRYNLEYNIGTYPTNPTNLTEGNGTGYKFRNGNYHGQTGVVWGTVALLNNTNNTGYVFMGSRTVDGNGAVPTPGNDNKYNYLKFTNNNLNFGQLTAADATKDHTVEGFYPLKKVTFKITTPFYAVEQTSAHIVSVADWVSQYTVDNDIIETKYLPSSLKRKYCNYTGKFYSDALCTNEITRFSEATDDPTEGYQVYIGYEVTSGIPFKGITPAATYTADTWANATWYELTDEGSTQLDGLKLKYDGTNFKNNGADVEFAKTSEFAFIGDPYELRVVLRSATQAPENTTYAPYYVGATGTPPTTGTNLTASTTASEGYQWELPNDATAGTFLLRKYKGTGNWYWEAGHPSPEAISYSTKAHTYNVLTANAQTITFNVSNLGYTEGDYILVTAGGTNADQVTVSSEKFYVQEGGTATFTAAIKGRGDGNKTFTLSIQKYTPSDATDGTPSVITVNQNSDAIVANTVAYSTTNATRVKLMDLPKRSFTYNIVDKSGRIAVKASATQTIFSPLSLASSPSIIVSPFLYGETLTFYSAYSGGGRGNLSSQITELTAGNAASTTDIYVKYTTTALDAKPYQLNEDQEIFVRLNGQYIYYEDGIIKSSATSEEEDKYKWKLRNRDPYDMLIDNMGARVALSVNNQSENPIIYDDNGGTTTPSRQKGAWVWLNNVALPSTSDGTALVFTTDRANAQHFIAKRSLAMGVYEVMVATGDAIDASTTYYNIGRPTDNTVKIYSNTTYAHGNAVLAFHLEETANYTYHLIDRANHELLTVSNKSPELALPSEYQSPLVGTYSYYALSQMTIDTSKTPYEYTPIDPTSKLTSISDLYAAYTYTGSDATAYSESGSSLEATDLTQMESQAKLLTAPGDYYYKVGSSEYKKVTVTRGFRGTDIYVTYVANDIVKFNTGQYMLKFLEPYATGYYLEDGNDKLTTSLKQPVYPYCNGDGNLNIYDNDMQKEQFNGGASTRPRWIWYFDSDSDPYHVTIRSRSTTSYNGIGNPTYLTTYAVHFNQDAVGEKTVVTGGTLTGIASVEPTEYMVLGSQGNYKLLTTNVIDDGTTTERRTVTSLEQYWKTYNMIKLDVLGLSKSTDAYSDDASTWVVPTAPASYRETIEGKGWHSYDAYANATRWNGYNDKSDGAGKKVVEKLEHWFQTFDMGTGTFDIESADIPPVLVLLDRHGWEIMRRPLPTSATYPDGVDELAALRVYDSPLVDRYYFYNNATKASGCHKYTLRLNDNGEERDQIKVNGIHYSSTSLGDLPPRSASGVVSGGAIQDFYVTYTVKEEYENNYDYRLTLNSGTSTFTETGTSHPYLVLQNGRFYKVENSDAADKKSYISKPVFEHTSPEGGNVYDLIVSPHNHGGNNHDIIDGSGNFLGNNFWYVKPNLNIDEEMGITWASTAGGSAEPLTEYETKEKYQDKSGFDPYNIQLELVNDKDGNPDGRYLTTHMTSASLENGIMVGDYSGTGGTKMITLEAECASPLSSEGYDHSTMQITNQTFMAVSDVNGNMQLMPRFDHTQRVDLQNANPWETQLRDPVDHAKASVDNNSSMGPQTTFFVRPQRFHYHIIDHEGREALRYKRPADFYPAITEHFKSPLAKDFIYYKNLTLSEGVYTEISTNADISEKQITGSFAEAGLDGVDEHVYVRYSYDEDADLDADKILQGQWFTVKLAAKDLQADGEVEEAEDATQGTGVNLYSDADTPTKPATIDEDDKKWQWKFLAAPMDPESEYYVEPDPYAVQLFNRQANYTSDPTVEPSPMTAGIKVPNANDGANRFALLSHPNGGYALAVAKTYSDYDYKFINGADMTDPAAGTLQAAGIASEANFNYKAGTLTAGAQVLVDDEVEHTYTYYVITNAGIRAISATQTNEEALSHGFALYLPESAQTPLLNMDDYVYYGFATDSCGIYSEVEQTKLFTLFGLYDDIVYVRYNAYDVDKTSFKVPNKKTTDGGHVARDANSVDVSMNINGGLPYNIIWYNDNMMQSSDNAAVSDGGSHSLSGNRAHVWYFTENDPYALKIKHKGGKCLDGSATMVAEGSAPTFMLLRKSGYDYGILQKTGTDDILSGYGQTTVTADPTKYIIFGLSIHDLIYRLVINTSNVHTIIPYRSGDENTYTESSTLAASDTLMIKGTTQRDLTSGSPAGATYQLGTTLSWNNPVEYHTYCYDAGSVSIGDDLVLPNIFYRPNCTFDFYIEGVYRHYPEANADEGKPFEAMNNKYKGLNLKKLMSDEQLIDQNVVVNVVYKFDALLETNAGEGFVTGMKPAGTHYEWYTFETTDATPQLAHYTYIRGMRAESGRALHYTNDYLWSPLGDPYGFKSYNRYIYKNNGGTTQVLTTDDIADGEEVKMGATADNANRDIYELLPGSTPGSGTFRVHPLLNTDNTLFLTVVESGDPGDIGKLILSDDTPVKEWTYGLSVDLLNPYYQGAGNVGGLTPEGKTACEEIQATYYTSDPLRCIHELQKICYNDANIIPYAPGYYRLHSQPGASGISPVRYASGYLHDIEQTAGESSTAIPMHFYSRVGSSPKFQELSSGGVADKGYTTSVATRGEIPVPATENDPSTVFRFTGSATEAKIQTQGLYAQGVQTDEHHGYAKMTPTEGSATSFKVVDIGGAVVIIYNEADSKRHYLNYNQEDADHIYDLQYFENVPVDGSKWCMEPANTLGLQIATHNGGDGYYYSTVYAPFDVLMPADAGGETYNAYVCKTWNDAGLHPNPVPAATVDAVDYTEGKFVPAGTPVIIRTSDETNSVSMAIPSASPTACMAMA